MKRHSFAYPRISHGKSYRFRIIAGYSAFTLMLMLISSLILMGFLNRKLEEDVATANRGLLAQAQIYGDTFVVGRIRMFVIEKFLDISRDSSVMEFFTGTPNTANLREVQDAVTNLQLYGAYIESAGLYRRADDTWIASDTGVTFGALSATEHPSETFNSDLIRSTLNDFDSARWLPPKDARSSKKADRVIAYCQPVPMFTKGGGRLGCFIASIDSDGLRKLLLTARTDPSAFELSIIDANGAIITGDEGIEALDAEVGKELREIVRSSDTGLAISDLFGKKVAVVWIKSTMADWKYIAISPLSKYRRGIVAVFQTIALIILIIAALGLVVVNIITFSLYKPIKRIISSARENLKDANLEGMGRDDLALVDEAINRLSGRINEMKSTLEENAPLIERAIVDDLLIGSIASTEPLKDRLRVIGKQFRSDQLSLTIVKLDSSLIELLPAEQREYLLFALTDLTAQALDDGAAQLVAARSGFQVVRIADNYDETASTRSYPQLARRARRELGATVNIAHIGTTATSAQLPEAYKRAENALRYTFFLGGGAILGPKDFARFDSAAKHSDSAIAKQMETLLLSNKFKEAKGLVKKVVTDLSNISLSYEAAFTLMRDFLLTFSRTGEMRGINSRLIARRSLDDAFEKLRSVQMFGQLCHSCLTEFEARVEERAAAVDMELYEAVIRYIESGAERGITLSEVAEKFAMSESHFGRWFRIANGANFSDFIIGKKLDRAANFLVSDPACPVKDIAKRLGYSDLSYFSSLFKERFGVTPVQYRKRELGKTQS